MQQLNSMAQRTRSPMSWDALGMLLYLQEQRLLQRFPYREVRFLELPQRPIPNLLLKVQPTAMRNHPLETLPILHPCRSRQRMTLLRFELEEETTQVLERVQQRPLALSRLQTQVLMHQRLQDQTVFSLLRRRVARLEVWPLQDCQPQVFAPQVNRLIALCQTAEVAASKPGHRLTPVPFRRPICPLKEVRSLLTPK